MQCKKMRLLKFLQGISKDIKITEYKNSVMVYI